MSPSRGVYFLANDEFLPYATAFLNSFRRYNPSVPLCLIPFADDIDQLVKLQPSHQFSVLDDLELLAACDDVGAAFRGTAYGHFRKLAMWEGQFDEFIYIDCDTVVLHNVEFVFDLLTEFGFVTAHGNDPATRQYVWNDSIYDIGVLTEKQISFAGATGFLASRKECLRLDEVRQRLPEAVKLAPHMFPELKDQPLLNFLMVTSKYRFTSLFGLTRTGTENFPLEWWGGDVLGQVRDGEIVWPHRHPPLLMHWSGQARRDGLPSVNQELWDFYREIVEAVPAPGPAAAPTGPVATAIACTFEDGTTQGWYSRSSGARVSTTSENAHRGKCSLLITGRTESWDGPRLDLPAPVSAGTTYTFSVWVRLVPGEDPATLKLSVEYGVNSCPIYDSVTPGKVVTADDWMTLKGKYTLAVSVEYFSVYVESVTGVASFYLDDFSMTLD